MQISNAQNVKMRRTKANNGVVVEIDYAKCMTYRSDNNGIVVLNERSVVSSVALPYLENRFAYMQGL